MAKTDSPSQLIDARIKELADWRAELLSQDTKARQARRPRCGRGVEVEGSASVVARRNDLHR